MRVLSKAMRRRRRWHWLKKKSKSPFQCGSTGGGLKKKQNTDILSHLRGERHDTAGRPLARGKVD
jgi:hypothetical protein